jgi:hypothetical protein
MVQMKTRGHPIDLKVDTSTKHPVVTQPLGPLSNKHTTIIGTTGDQAHHPFLMARRCDLGSHEVRHEFLYLPDCQVGLMATDFCANLWHR